MRRTLIALVGLALALAGCGPDNSTAPPASTQSSPGAGSSATASSGDGPSSGPYCAQWRTRRETIARRYRDATRQTDPTALRTDIDAIGEEYEALAEAAPPELHADHQVMLQVFDRNRDAIAKANWTPVAVIGTLGDNLEDDGYLTAYAHIATYLRDHCGIDIGDATGS
jgi:hypothetical protein